MPNWDPLLSRLAEGPRENGSAALDQAASFLAETLAGMGLETELVPFTAHPFALRLAGLVVLAGGLAFLRLGRSGRWPAAAMVSMALPGLLLAELEFGQPVFGWIGARTEHHVVARIPAHTPEQRLILSAHYDSKTDLLDHLERAPVDWLAPPVASILVLGALAGWRAPRSHRHRLSLDRMARFSCWLAPVYGAAAFAVFSAGAWLPERSHGALDDGAACAVLVELARELGARPPPDHTEVEILLLAAEEVGVQGSRQYARERFSRRTGDGPPTRVLNLEGIGASPQLAVFGRERFALRSFRPSSELLAVVDRVYQRARGEPMPVTWYGGATDARSFLAQGIPALTLISREPGQTFIRGLHSAADRRSRLDETSLDETLRFLLEVVEEVDAAGR
jgi:acetylornithine deacetylase/succinyl-diaminopimelate desuccinylase-like protein